MLKFLQHCHINASYIIISMVYNKNIFRSISS